MNNYHETFKGARVLITGGLGFIGSTLAKHLVGLGAQITLVDSLIPTYGGNLRNIAGIEDQVRVNIADVRDEYSMDYLVQGRDFLFNLAGQNSHIDSMRDPHADLGYQLPGAALYPGGLPQAQPQPQAGLCLDAPDLWQARLSAGR